MNATSDRLSRWTLVMFPPGPGQSRSCRPRVPATHGLARAQLKGKCIDCVEVCPIDCFYAGETMLVIPALFMDRLRRSSRRRRRRAAGAS